MKLRIAISLMVFALLSGSVFAQESTPAEGEYSTYIVKWFDDIRSVAAKFGMTVDELMAYNGLTSEKFERKQILKIPKDKAKGLKQIDTGKIIREADEKVNKVFDKVEKKASDVSGHIQKGISAVDSLATEAVGHAKEFLTPEEPKDRIDITLILPLGSDEDLNNQNYDFYSGMLIALKDLGRSGTKTRLKVIDTKDADVDITSLDLSGEDLVIGPVEPEGLSKILPHCAAKTAVISPLDPKGAVLVTGHANLFQIPSSIDAQYRDIIEWIRSDRTEGDRIILISDKEDVPTPIARLLSESGLPYETLDYGILEGRTVSAALEKMVTETGVNRVVIASENEAFVNDAVRNLNLMTFHQFDIELYAPSKIRNYETVDIESLHNISTHISSSYYVDYDSDKVKRFLLSYRAFFETEPTPFAFQGYDTAWCLVSRISIFADSWSAILENERFKGLQSDILFKREGEDSGCVNTAVRRIVFEKNYSVTLL